MPFPLSFRRCMAGLCLVVAAAARAQDLPAEIEAALARSQLPRDAVTLLVADAQDDSAPRLALRADAPVNPASIAKLATTLAALEVLGPAYTWSTPVYLDGPIRHGVLHGNLYLQGLGDPQLVAERLWLLLRQVQGLGVRRIEGDIVLDRSAFDIPDRDPAAFDGEPLRPYNAAPDALLVNFRSVLLQFTPVDGIARVQMLPPVAGVKWPRQVPLSPGACGDWRGALRADFSDAQRIRFAGAYPSDCGERSWPVASTDPERFAARAIAGMWQELGGTLAGRVREGRVPAALEPVLKATSPPLAEVVRAINKYSNNVMAQQVFLTLSLAQGGRGTWDGSRALMQQWWHERLGGEAPVFTNGAGLSREERISAAQLLELLRHAWASPVMAEFVASLPVSGVDGTARRTGARSEGLAHLKTGSLRDVAGVAGYVLGPNGRRRVVVAIANHPRASAFRPVIDAVVDWAARQP